MKLSDYLESLERGAKAKLAAQIGAHASDLSDWISGSRPVPVHRCASIERATKGAVTRRDLRPDDWQDIWPELDGAQAIADEQIQPQAPASQALAATESVVEGVA